MSHEPSFLGKPLVRTIFFHVELMSRAPLFLQGVVELVERKENLGPNRAKSHSKNG